MFASPGIWGLLAVALAGPLCASAEGIASGVSWDWQLQAPLDLGVPVDVLALDPDEVSAAEVAALSARAVTTVCYVSVGTLEDWRDDADRFPAALVGRAYDGWPGERFLDIRAGAQLLPIMAARFRHCAEMGFDAVEPDNIDLHVNDTGFPLTPADVVAWFTELAAVAHDLGLLVAQKNAPDLTAELAPFADFAIAEDCFAEGWCADLAIYPRTGRALLAAEYGAASDSICTAAAQLGASVIFKRRDVTRWRRVCPS